MDDIHAKTRSPRVRHLGRGGSKKGKWPGMKWERDFPVHARLFQLVGLKGYRCARTAKLLARDYLFLGEVMDVYERNPEANDKSWRKILCLRLDHRGGRYKTESDKEFEPEVELLAQWEARRILRAIRQQGIQPKTEPLFSPGRSATHSTELNDIVRLNTHGKDSRVIVRSKLNKVSTRESVQALKTDNKS